MRSPCCTPATSERAGCSTCRSSTWRGSRAARSPSSGPIPMTCMPPTSSGTCDRPSDARSHDIMSSVIIAGGSVVGLGAALALADRGYQVEILERLPDQPPASIEEAASWQRPTVPQAVHSHAFASRGCNLLRERAPDVYDGLLAAGASEINLADYPPPTLRGFSRRPSDDNLRMVTCRRSTFELVLRQRTLARPGVRLSTDTTVRGLITADDDPMRVTGVRLADGQARFADLIIDAT